MSLVCENCVKGGERRVMVGLVAEGVVILIDFVFGEMTGVLNGTGT